MLWWTLRQLKSKGWKTRMRAAEKLGDSKDGRTVEPLLAALQDEDVWWAAAEALAKIGDAAVEPLVAALRDEDRHVRWAAARALGEIGDARAVEPLVAALKDKEDLRAAAAEALGAIGDARAVEPLAAALKDEEWPVRQAAAEALGKIGDARALEPLAAALKDPDVGGAAASALGKIGDARAVQPLLAMLQDKWVRGFAQDALRDIGARNSEAVQALAEYHARKEAAARLCPRCGKAVRVEKASRYVEGHVCDSCGWAAVWCYECKEAPMKATPEVWPKPGMPLQAWLDCEGCGKRSRADYDIIGWLQHHGAL